MGSLHDAGVVSIWQAQKRLTMVLQREGQKDRFLVLTYSLVDEPYLDPSALPEKYRSPLAAWLYDEIDVEPEPAETLWSHAILLSNGWEVRLRFQKVSISRPKALLPDGASFALPPQNLLTRSA
jgi:hypothetical protein